MLIREIIVTESYADDLIATVQDTLSMLRDDDTQELSTQEVKQLMTDQGFHLSDEELIAAIDQSGFANSVDKDRIVPKNALPDIGDDEEGDMGPSVSDMADDQAMKDVEDEL
jgi:hypothetical protein